MAGLNRARIAVNQIVSMAFGSGCDTPLDGSAPLYQCACALATEPAFSSVRLNHLDHAFVLERSGWAE